MAQNLTTNIIINAKTGNGFGKVGATLTEMGMIVNGISQQLISFGEDSVKVYRDYELSMRDAEVALSTTYGRGTQQLRGVMNQLDTAATEWAATTIFHTNDVANAISEAAHAGWDYDRIMTGLPAAMELAQAGNLDLSDSVNYLVKATSAAGIGFEDIGQFIDLWAFAANSSASTIGEFGDAMLRMGSTMRFAANPEELMTLIAVTANAGSVGSEAGTMIRNSIMRLVAPTQKAEKAMAELGATTLETAGLMEDESLAAANATLAAHGFSVYDDGGNLRNVLDIYRDLYLALGDVAGGFENIDRNEEALSILSAIFPTRTITEALTLIRAASQEYGGLYEAMLAGDAEDYGSYASETMMDSLNGNIEIFESKVERLQQLVGGELKPLVETAAEFGGNIIDSIAEMDPGAFSALVDGLTVVAAAGPSLLVAGAAFRLIGLAMTPIGAAALGLTALTATAVALKDLSDSRFAEQFGSMEMDSAALTERIGNIGEGFREAYSQVDSFTQAMNEAVQSYETASSTFSGTLLTDMLTHAQLTETDKAKLTQLGTDMFTAVQEAIANSTAASMSYWQTLFGGDGTAEYDPAYQQIIELTNQAYEDAIAQAEGISQGLRDAMSSAFADGEISEEEYQQILSYVQSYNDALARAAAEARSEDEYVQMQKWLHQAQTASWEEIQEISATAQTERDAYLAEVEDRYLTERYRAQYRGADEATLEEADARHQAEVDAINARYNQFLMDLYGSQRGQNDLTPTADGRVLATQYEAMGGQEGIDSAADAYAAAGNTEAAAQLEQFQSDFADAGITSTGRVWWNPLTWFKGYETQADQTAWADAMGAAYAAASSTTYTPIAQQQAQTEFWQNYFNTQAQMAAENPYMFMPPEAAAGAQAGAALSQWLFGTSPTVTVTPQLDTSALPDMPPMPMPVTPYVEGTDAVESLQNQGVQVNVEGDTQQLSATIDAEDGQTLLQYVSGDATDLHMTIMDEDGKTLRENVTGDATQLASVINSFQGRTITVNVSGRRLFAEGGRATTASIFGEAGPEWAIPEEHSENTAALLNAARAASGFTWPDLLARFGGMNANPNNRPTTFVYSPVINAADARGVEAVLQQDKQRLERWWEERKMRDAMEVYA